MGIAFFLLVYYYIIIIYIFGILIRGGINVYIATQNVILNPRTSQTMNTQSLLETQTL